MPHGIVDELVERQTEQAGVAENARPPLRQGITKHMAADSLLHPRHRPAATTPRSTGARSSRRSPDSRRPSSTSASLISVSRSISSIVLPSTRRYSSGRRSPHSATSTPARRRGDRRAQVVSQLADDAAVPCGGMFQPAEHGVEYVDETLKLDHISRGP